MAAAHMDAANPPEVRMCCSGGATGQNDRGDLWDLEKKSALHVVVQRERIELDPRYKELSSVQLIKIIPFKLLKGLLLQTVLLKFSSVSIYLTY